MSVLFVIVFWHFANKIRSPNIYQGECQQEYLVPRCPLVSVLRPECLDVDLALESCPAPEDDLRHVITLQESVIKH